MSIIDVRAAAQAAPIREVPQRPAHVRILHRPHPPAARATLDGRTVAGLAFGITGLVIFNIICGPVAVALGISGYRHSTDHIGRGAAATSILLGLADLAVLAALVFTRILDNPLITQLYR